MEIRENVDTLMEQVRIKRKMYEKIMEGKEMGSRRRFTIRKAVVPAAAAVLLMSTMYVGAGYLAEYTPLRELFMSNTLDEPLEVPEGQKVPDIYEDILDTNMPTAGETGEGEAVRALDSFGERIIDNELFSLDVVEVSCTGRELSFRYILTKKTEQELWTDVFIARSHDEREIASGFGDFLRPDQIPADSGYELAENQELWTCTQLGKEDYASGRYTLYVDYQLLDSSAGTKQVIETDFGPTELIAVETSDKPDSVEASIEITSKGDYCLALEGLQERVEKNVHFNAYDVYITPLTVYLTLDGTYEEEMTGDWGMASYHDIRICFTDGTETTARVMLSSMSYGHGAISVDMRKSFDSAIDPGRISSVSLDGVVITGQ
ncbi:MAG: hypothetical protein NC245_01255 [Muribaculum sp.]|nr:hypothetical protein [Muribaculum sp.]